MNNKNKSFEDYLKEYMKAYSEGGMEAVSQLIKDNGLSENASIVLNDANSIIDYIDSYAKELSDFKNAGGSTREWEAVKLEDLIIE